MPGSVWLIRLITFYVIKRFSHPVGTEIDNFMKSCTAIYFCTALERLESSDVAEPSPFSMDLFRGELLRLLTQLGEWISEQSLRYIQSLYEIESEVRDLEPDLRRQIR
jgi:hypothetical protein